MRVAVKGYTFLKQILKGDKSTVTAVLFLTGVLSIQMVTHLTEDKLFYVSESIQNNVTNVWETMFAMVFVIGTYAVSSVNDFCMDHTFF